MIHKIRTIIMPYTKFAIFLQQYAVEDVAMEDVQAQVHVLVSVDGQEADAHQVHS